MKAGAVDFLAKPFRDQDLLDAVAAAIQRDEKRREHEHMITELKADFRLLTLANAKLWLSSRAG